MKRAATAAPAPANRTRSVRPLISVLLTLGGAGLVLLGLSVAGDEARRHLGPRDRYTVRFADIRCEPPPNASRATFLTEVRYASGADRSVRALDPDLKKKISAAFAAHPWVARVDAVAVDPPNTVTVALTYRKPVLAAPQTDGPRAVDAKGVLLPATAPTDGLPELLGAPELPPAATAGQPWPNDDVVRAAAVAAEYRPLTIERKKQGWELVLQNKQKVLVSK
ncbi:MAG: cell division protein FtsQ/DivIB [Gemmata sp.]